MQDTIINKIEALLRLAARSPFKAEIENAMSKAHAIALKHQIDISRLSVEDRNQEEFTKEIVADGERIANMLQFISPILLRFYRIQILRSTRNRKTTLFFIGRPSEIAVAIFTYNFLTTTFYRLWKAEKQSKNLPVFYKKSFCIGLKDGLTNKLYSIEKETLEQQEQNVQNQFALMIVNEKEQLKAALSTMFGRVKFGKPKKVKINSEVYERGVERGKAVEINKPLTN